MHFFGCVWRLCCLTVAIPNTRFLPIYLNMRREFETIKSRMAFDPITYCAFS